MGLFDFFKKPDKVSFQSSPLREPAEAGVKEVISDIRNLEEFDFNREDFTSPLRSGAVSGAQSAISGVSDLSPFTGNVETPSSSLTELGRQKVLDRGTGELDLSAFDEFEKNVLSAFDAETPQALSPIVEQNIAGGTLTSGAGVTDVNRGLTERASQRAALSSQIGKEKLQFGEGVRQQNLSNLMQFGSQEEQREASNLANQASLHFQNAGLQGDQAQLLSNIVSQVVLPEEAQRLNELLQEFTINKNLPFEKAQQLQSILGTILNSEVAKTEIQRFNSQRQSPFSIGIQGAIANLPSLMRSSSTEDVSNGEASAV